MTDTYAFVRAVEDLQRYLEHPESGLDLEDLRYVLSQASSFIEIKADVRRLNYMDMLLQTGWVLDDWRGMNVPERDGVRFGFGADSYDVGFDELTPFGANIREAIDKAREYVEARSGPRQ